MKKIIFGLLLIFGIGASNLNAQDFPSTEKECQEILCRGKWTLTTMSNGEKSIPASELGLEVIMVFRADSTYTVTLDGKAKEGTWKLDMKLKQVALFEGQSAPEGHILELKKGRIVIKGKPEEDEKDNNLRMIFEQFVR